MCPKCNPRKSLHVSQGHFPFPLGPFEVQYLDFIQMPLSQGYKCVLLLICMLSQWVEQESNSLMVGKLLLGGGIPIGEFPLRYTVTE